MPDSPVRVQRSRAQGSRTPPGARYVGRPTRFGNPFGVGDPLFGAWHERVGEVRDRAHAVQLFEAWLDGARMPYSGLSIGYPYAPAPTRVEIRRHLAGRDLACWCPLDEPCHADVLLRIANEETP